MTKSTQGISQIRHGQIVPPSPVGEPAPCPSWCDEPQGHDYEWDVDAYTRVHHRRLEGTGYGVRVSMMGVVSRVGEVEETPDDPELDVYMSKDLLSAQAARAMAAHLEEAAAILDNGRPWRVRSASSE